VLTLSRNGTLAVSLDRLLSTQIDPQVASLGLGPDLLPPDSHQRLPHRDRDADRRSSARSRTRSRRARSPACPRSRRGRTFRTASRSPAVAASAFPSRAARPTDRRWARPAGSLARPRASTSTTSIHRSASAPNSPRTS
jgi:hypothetical protein